MFGAFGMLALAVLVFCLRAMQTDAVWAGTVKFVRVGFWGLNGGLALMVLTDLFPGGVLQLWDSMSHGYWHARRLTYLMSGTFHTLTFSASTARVGQQGLVVLGQPLRRLARGCTADSLFQGRAGL